MGSSPIIAAPQHEPSCSGVTGTRRNNWVHVAGGNPETGATRSFPTDKEQIQLQSSIFQWNL